jgi:hypothetical protein
MARSVGGYMVLDRYGNEEIPVKVLMDKNCGVLQEVFAIDVLRTKVFDFVPKHPSAFDSNKAHLKSIYDTWAPFTDIVIDSTMMKCGVTRPGAAQPFLIEQARRIVEALLRQGINHGNTMELKRAGTVGPWPATVTEAQLTSAMQGAYYVLVTLIREMKKEVKDMNHELAGDLMSDLQGILSPAWNGVYGWRN